MQWIECKCSCIQYHRHRNYVSIAQIESRSIAIERNKGIFLNYSEKQVYLHAVTFAGFVNVVQGFGIASPAIL